MRSQVVILQPHHEKAARAIADLLRPQIDATSGCFVVGVAGESGAGKSEIAAALGDALAKGDIRNTVLQQDDYFTLPPSALEERRRSDIGNVGMSEVRLDLLEKNLSDVIAGAPHIVKPTVDIDEDSIGEETIYLGRLNVVIVEGTYTCALESVHKQVFIDRTYIDMRAAGGLPEDQDEFTERLRKIEHDIVSSHKRRADIIVTREYAVKSNDP